MESSEREENKDGHKSPGFEIIQDKLAEDNQIFNSSQDPNLEYGNDLWDSLHIL
tara:strand:- start:393 stop:554 length:162 start_codon:yes stop_codon:yes gene_type:complete